MLSGIIWNHLLLSSETCWNWLIHKGTSSTLGWGRCSQPLSQLVILCLETILGREREHCSITKVLNGSYWDMGNMQSFGFRIDPSQKWSKKWTPVDTHFFGSLYTKRTLHSRITGRTQTSWHKDLMSVRLHEFSGLAARMRRRTKHSKAVKSYLLCHEKERSLGIFCIVVSHTLSLICMTVLGNNEVWRASMGKSTLRK